MWYCQTFVRRSFTVFFQELAVKFSLPVMIFTFMIFHSMSFTILILGQFFAAFFLLNGQRSKPQDERSSQSVYGPVIPFE